jgi:small-conductance mechanosensitive channel
VKTRKSNVWNDAIRRLIMDKSSGTTENQLKAAILNLIKMGRNLREQITLLSGDLSYVLKEKQLPPSPPPSGGEQPRITPIKDDLKVARNTIVDCEATINDIRGRLWA